MTLECNVCQGSFTKEEGGRCGYIGILSVAFCPTCYTGLADMVEQTDYREWEGLTNNELQPIADEYRILFGSWVEEFARAIEEKLKEKNEL